MKGWKRGVDDRRRWWQDPIVVKSTSKYLKRNLVTLAASGKAWKILSEPAFSGGDAENSLPVARRSFDYLKCNRNTSMRFRKSEYMNHRVHIRMEKIWMGGFFGEFFIGYRLLHERENVYSQNRS